MLFRVGPYIALAGSASWPLSLCRSVTGLVGRDMNIAILFMLAVMSSEVFGLLRSS